MNHTDPTLSRADFQKEARRILGENWIDQLHEITQTNRRTIERLGSERNPLDARRLCIVALRLLGDSDSADEMARVLIEAAIKLIEQDRRERRAQSVQSD